MSHATTNDNLIWPAQELINKVQEVAPKALSKCMLERHDHAAQCLNDLIVDYVNGWGVLWPRDHAKTDGTVRLIFDIECDSLAFDDGIQVALALTSIFNPMSVEAGVEFSPTGKGYGIILVFEGAK